ncbi:MAG: protease modulator HflC [Myxococcota bacterium]|nr:protease modulator HflC [Myxococcota bacterium]MEC8381631.1 protease modulator HflC [Myxococcota bacterium]
MNLKTIAIIGTIIVWMSTAIFTLDARSLGVVNFFGETVQTVIDPGLHLKAPWPFHVLKRYDRRTQLLVLEPTEAYTSDTKNVVLTPFVLWKVSDPKRFLESLRELEAVQAPLGDVVISRIAAAIGEVSFSDILNTEGAADRILPEDIVSKINQEVEQYGINVELVRLRHIGLPIQNEQSIYERMRAERSRIAKKYRSEGEEEALKIRAKADRDAVEIQANADRDAAEIIAKAEKEAAALYAEQYSQAPDLYQLLIDLEASEATFESGGTFIFDSNERPFSTVLEEQ